MRVQVANAFFNDKEDGSNWYDVVSVGRTRDGTFAVMFETDEDSTRPGIYAIAGASRFFLGFYEHDDEPARD